MLNKQLIVCIFLALSMVSLSSQQFSYSANWGKRSDSIEKIESIEKSTESQSTEESIEENSNIMNILMSHEKVCINKKISERPCIKYADKIHKIKKSFSVRNLLFIFTLGTLSGDI